jgi:hypothetical protein
MLEPKILADIITFMRVLIGILLAWLGIAYGARALAWAIWLMIADWTGDILDGAVARLSRKKIITWIGSHDLEVDMAVSIGLLVYLVGAGMVAIWLGLVYFCAWMLLFWRIGLQRSLGMLFQAPIYAWFIWVGMRDAPMPGFLMLVWIAAAILITWPRFPNQVIPGFLKGMHGLNDGVNSHQHGGRGA